MKLFTKSLCFSLLAISGMLSAGCGSSDGTQQEKKMQDKQIQQVTSTPSQDNSSLEILPTMQTPSQAANQLWVGTFQLVWNDFMDHLTKGPVVFLEGNALGYVEELNQQLFTKAELSAKDYYTKWGETSPTLKQEIEQAIKAKFGESSSLLEDLDWTAKKKKFVLYAMLKKNFQFIEKFDDMKTDSFRGSERDVSYFGTNYEHPAIRVQFYNNEDDFAVTLTTKQGDLVHLYRTNAQGTLAQLYAKFSQEAQAYAGERAYTYEDVFKAPKLDFKSRTEFLQLYDKPIKLPNPEEYAFIEKALETIEFEMNEVGAKVESEAAMEVDEELGEPDSILEEWPGRRFLVTGPYALFLEEPGKQPYLAMHITDAAKLQPGAMVKRRARS